MKAEPSLQEDSQSEPERVAMVKEQILARGISAGKILEAFRSVPRHIFVKEELRSAAYSDHPLPIGEGQTISQPYMVAYMTDMLDPQPDGVILEIGTGSGYQTAILALLCAEVYTMERIPSLLEQARARIKKLGIKNVHFLRADGYEGWKEHAPYDGIIVTAAAPSVPEELMRQLKEGARLVIPVGEDFQDLVLVTKEKEKYHRKSLGGCIFVPLVHDKDSKTV
ncbi:MAG TPA: protein-L-isoaspartate(D-aspartate) O-methyltransferase [bacterium]|nr:protein-L-isoaspartate(D-aspartate) O-methyltransferase [bacterium]